MTVDPEMEARIRALRVTEGYKFGKREGMAQGVGCAVLVGVAFLVVAVLVALIAPHVRLI
jgi:threonine/homoserine/homoserine lactone efflux protein